jgi:hypothetical protein
MRHRSGRGSGGGGRRAAAAILGGLSHLFLYHSIQGIIFFLSTPNNKTKTTLYIRTLIFRPWMEMAGAVSAAAGDGVVGSGGRRLAPRCGGSE